MNNRYSTKNVQTNNSEESRTDRIFLTLLSGHYHCDNSHLVTATLCASGLEED